MVLPEVTSLFCLAWVRHKYFRGNSQSLRTALETGWTVSLKRIESCNLNLVNTSVVYDKMSRMLSMVP